MVSETPNGAAEAAKDVELSQSDKNQEEQHDSLDKVHKEDKKLPDFFPSHGLTTSGAILAPARACGMESIYRHHLVGSVQRLTAKAQHGACNPNQCASKFVCCHCPTTLVDLLLLRPAIVLETRMQSAGQAHFVTPIHMFVLWLVNVDHGQLQACWTKVLLGRASVG